MGDGGIDLFVLAKQAEGTVTYSINACNEASNSKQQIILCTKDNVIEKIKATKLNLENKELQKNSFELNDLVIKNLEIDSDESTIYLFDIKIDRKCRIGSIYIKDFKIKKHITELEILLKKLIDNINNNKEYSLKQEYLLECYQIKIDSEYNNISKDVENEYVYKIKQEILRQLKRKYPNEVVRRKRIKTKEPKIIVLIEAIGVEKSIFGEKFKSYLEEKGYKVYRPVEASLIFNDELKLFCKDPKNNTLFFNIQF
ncbi:30445_t:CDS:2 [Racocetra persica]|uniref:30445_t:CDS:1 n=1 Tax=Racocetra persica TaxID=160502 RepID=A0ACA9LHE4_9GLOM|nr:30445_t:CDS:2 [Racocetra persica]